jgi:uncharacterized protein (TIGR00369 family)
VSGSKALELIGEDLQLLVVHVPHARAIGLAVVDAQPGHIWLRVPYADFLVGNPETGVIHGGVITTLLDNGGGAAVMTALDELRAVATLDLRIDYMKPATPGRDILGHCHCHKVTRNVAFVRGTAYHDTPDDPIATAAMTFMVGANRTLPGLVRGA